MKYGKRRSRKGDSKFNPNRDYIKKAVQRYTEDGGTITKVEFDDKAYQVFVDRPDFRAVDDFLKGIL